MKWRLRKLKYCSKPNYKLVASLICSCLPLISVAGTLSLPYVEDFESGSDFLTDWNRNNNGSSNKAEYVTSPVYDGKKSFMFVVNTQDDGAAYRSEVQSHPPSDDFLYGDTFWTGFAVQWPTDYKTAGAGHVTFMQLKHLSPQKQIYFSEQKGQFWLGNGHSSPPADIYIKPYEKGKWYYVMTRVDANCQNKGGQVKMWIENANFSKPDVTHDTSVLDDAEGCENMNRNELYLKLGMYRAWMRHSQYASKIVPGQHKVVFDNIRICREGSTSCSNEQDAFAWVLQGRKGSLDKPSQPSGIELKVN